MGTVEGSTTAKPGRLRTLLSCFQMPRRPPTHICIISSPSTQVLTQGRGHPLSSLPRPQGRPWAHTFTAARREGLLTLPPRRHQTARQGGGGPGGGPASVVLRWEGPHGSLRGSKQPRTLGEAGPSSHPQQLALGHTCCELTSAPCSHDPFLRELTLLKGAASVAGSWN